MSTNSKHQKAASRRSQEQSQEQDRQYLEDVEDYLERHCSVTGRELFPKDIYDDPGTRQITLSIIAYVDLLRICELTGTSLNSLASIWVSEGAERFLDRCRAELVGKPLPTEYPRLPDRSAVEKYVAEYDLPVLPGRKWIRRLDKEK